MSENAIPSGSASPTKADTTTPPPNPLPSASSTPSQAVPAAQSSSTLAAPLVGPDGTPITASAANTVLAHPVPTKPRSNSQLRADRPAPPSPAPSRPGSQVLSPQLLAANFPSPSPGPRDRAGSTSSSRGGRRVSSSSGPSRAGAKPRPRSALGASSFLPGGTDGETPDTATPPETSLAQSTIPEDRAVATEAVQPEPKEPEVVIRDYAFPASDPRFAGPGLPLSAPSRSSSRRNSRWGPSESPDPASGSSSSGRKGSSWSGFGLLNWRSIMGRRKSNDDSSQAVDDDDDDDDESEDFRLPAPDHDEDDYAFSDSETPSEEGEPWGFYRAAFAFEAVGEHEIGLEEGTIVEVRGRGGGDGWVVAVKRRLDEQGRVIRLDEAGEGEGKEGLVPEGYLEKAGDLEMAPPTEAEAEMAPPAIADTKTASPTTMGEVKRDQDGVIEPEKTKDTTSTKLDDDHDKGVTGQETAPRA